MRSFGLTDKGLRREFNEDYFYRSDKSVGVLPNLYIVADGMGGHNAGDVASKQAVAYLIQYIEKTDADIKEVEQLLIDGILYANEKVYNESLEKDELSGMGTTLVVSTIIDGVAIVANVGDSRLYRMAKSLKQVTIDHSVVEELYRAGHITKSERMNHPDKNMITRAIGVEGEVIVDCFSVSLTSDDLIIMCTDGLNKMILDQEIETMLGTHRELKQIASELIDGAIKKGGNDNVTVIVLRLGNEVGL